MTAKKIKHTGVDRKKRMGTVLKNLNKDNAWCEELGDVPCFIDSTKV